MDSSPSVVKRSNSSDDSTEPPSKRTKAVPMSTGESVQDESGTAVTTDPDFWPSTEFVVVEAEQTRFKLLKSRLSKESAVFRDVFAGQERKHVEHVGSTDGLELYRVTGVSKDDFKALLLVMEKSLEYINERPDNTLACSLLRASHHLGFEEYRAWVIDILQEEYVSVCFEHRYSHAAEVLQAARTCDAPELVQRAYYELLREDGFASRDSKKGDVVLHKAVPTESLLSSKDIVEMTKVREWLADAWMDIIRSPPAPPCDTPMRSIGPSPCGRYGRVIYSSCTSPSNAAAWSQHVSSNNWSKQSYRRDPIRGLDILIGTAWNLAEGWRVCGNCEREIKRIWRMRQLELWGLLGEKVGL
ncbi:hypothetical protein PLICRDRAFT_55558 [Plicaturopsis crispa FD-325 SS-3]|nr:hypothetical protein PLICRDRAFT_55558 [Plicaturopsis crispa FD-325 SS-3]